jgi:hypothetical protein
MSKIEQYRQMLRVNKHRLDDELEMQAEILDQISASVVLAASRVADAKDELAKVEGALGDGFRDDDVKLTVAQVDARVRRDPQRVRAFERYHAQRAEHEAWAGLYDAWKQKGYSIKTLADLYAANYFALASHQIRERPDRYTGHPAQAPAASEPVSESRGRRRLV